MRNFCQILILFFLIACSEKVPHTKLSLNGLEVENYKKLPVLIYTNISDKNVQFSENDLKNHIKKYLNGYNIEYLDNASAAYDYSINFQILILPPMIESENVKYDTFVKLGFNRNVRYRVKNIEYETLGTMFKTTEKTGNIYSDDYTNVIRKNNELIKKMYPNNDLLISKNIYEHIDEVLKEFIDVYLEANQ